MKRFPPNPLVRECVWTLVGAVLDDRPLVWKTRCKGTVADLGDSVCPYCRRHVVRRGLG